MVFNRIPRLSAAFIAAMVVAACSSSDESNKNNTASEPGLDAGPEVEPEPAVDGSTEATASDPLCGSGLQCSDTNGKGMLACLVNGKDPAGAATDCHTGAGCKGNQGCRYTNDDKTQSVCEENCGTCGAGTTCMDVSGDGYLGCLNGGQIPSTAQTQCHSNGGCSGNATCFYVNTEKTESVCITNCSPCQAGTCAAGLVCDGIACVPAPCTADSCATGETCYSGTCIPDIGAGPGTDTVTCDNLPKLLCDPAQENCAELIQFDPNAGDGYVDYPENGETATNQYRSWLRRDAVYLIKYASARVACKAKAWKFGNGGPVGLIDMSEKDGKIPGTSTGDPGHPAGTHTNGFDIDLAYFQVNTQDNRARPICEHYSGGKEAYHCTKPPHLLDTWREALFIGSLAEHPNLRVIGCDGQAGGMIEAAMATLCKDGWITPAACKATKLTYEVTNQGNGWFQFHHHHIHVSFSGTKAKSMGLGMPTQCLVPGCDKSALDQYILEQTRFPTIANYSPI